METQEVELSELEIVGNSNINRAIYALLFTVLALVLPSVNPELAASIGGVFDEPLQLITQLIGGLAGDIGQYEADITTLVFGSGVSSVLVFGLTSLLKKIPQLAKVKSDRIATILSLVIFTALFASRKWGFEVEFDNVQQLAVMALTLFAGVGASQLGSSVLHNQLVETSSVFAFHRNTQT